MAQFKKVGALWKRANGKLAGEIQLGDGVSIPCAIGPIGKVSENAPDRGLIVTGLFPVEASEAGVVAKSKLFSPQGTPERTLLIIRNQKTKDSQPDYRITLVTEGDAGPEVAPTPDDQGSL